MGAEDLLLYILMILLGIVVLSLIVYLIFMVSVESIVGLIEKWKRSTKGIIFKSYIPILYEYKPGDLLYKIDGDPIYSIEIYEINVISRIDSSWLLLYARTDVYRQTSKISIPIKDLVLGDLPKGIYKEEKDAQEFLNEQYRLEAVRAINKIK